MSYRYIEHPDYYHPRQQSIYDHHGNHHHRQLQQSYRQPPTAYHYPVHKKYYARPTLVRSRSSGTHHSSSYYDERDYDYNKDYDWYYGSDNQQQQQHVPSSTYREKKKKHREHLDEDGEPLSDLELLAKHNAAQNALKSRLSIYSQEDEQEEIAALPKEDCQESGEENTNAMENLTVIDSSSTASTMVEEDDESKTTSTAPSITNEEPAKVQAPPKKKRWPFAFLFKKDQPVPTKSISTPPTPVLSPDNNSSMYSSNITAFSSTSDHDEGGTWAFRCPTPVPMTPAVWIHFDHENQKKIASHLKSNQTNDDVVQFTDSHICGGNLPVAVVPVQMRCYIPTDLAANQITYVELNFIPNKR